MPLTLSAGFTSRFESKIFKDTTNSNNILVMDVSPPTLGEEVLNEEVLLGDDSEVLRNMAHAVPPPFPPVHGPVQILIFGDSFVRRLNVFMNQRYGGYHNYNLDYAVAEVHTYGISGLTCTRALSHHMDVFYNIRPTVVFIQLGSNDLCEADMDMHVTIANFMELGRQLVNLGVRRILYGQVLMRHGPGLPLAVPDYNDRVLTLNHEIWSSLPTTMMPSYFWRHRGFWLSQFSLMDNDGIHLNQRGCNRFFRSVRGGLLLALSSLNNTLV